MIAHQHGIIELTYRGRDLSKHSVTESDPLVEFTSPSGACRKVRAFWEGATVWRVRFSPDEIGEWTWRVLNDCATSTHRIVTGRFQCASYQGDNPLYHHGPLRVAAGGRHLEHADGTPFFWLGDTAWNGVIRGDDANWRRYLQTRARQRFSVIQFVCTDWRGDMEDPAGERACASEDPFLVNPAFFQRLDRRIAMINEHGLLAAPVALWTLLPTDAGQRLSEEAAAQLASYIVARYDAYQVCWLLGGDGPYQKLGVDRWKRIGRTAFLHGHGRLATLHPCGLNWVGEEFRDEPWYSLIGYQSGHGGSDSDLAWLVRGPPASLWNRPPIKPVINLEPNYETAHAYQSGNAFTDYHVRRAAWWSLLVSPPAGLTYGHDAVWNWNFETGPSEGHGHWHNGAVPPWYTGLETEGIRSMTVLRAIIERLHWTTLTPAPDILSEQQGHRNIHAYQAAARDTVGTMIVYAPTGGEVRFTTPPPTPVRLVDPRTGVVFEYANAMTVIHLPSDQDWLVIAGPGWREKT